MKAVLPLPVRFTCESTLGYRPIFDHDRLLELAFEEAGYDFVRQIIERRDEADELLSTARIKT